MSAQFNQQYTHLPQQRNSFLSKAYLPQSELSPRGYTLEDGINMNSEREQRDQYIGSPSSLKQQELQVYNRNQSEGHLLIDIKGRGSQLQQQFVYGQQSTVDSFQQSLNSTPNSKKMPFQLNINSLQTDHDHLLEECKSERSIRCGDKSELIQSRIEKARKAIESYKEYKSEISFSLESQNTSKLSLMDNLEQTQEKRFSEINQREHTHESEEEGLYSFLNQTPIVKNEQLRIDHSQNIIIQQSRSQSIIEQQQPSVNEASRMRSPESKPVQNIFDYNKARSHNKQPSTQNATYSRAPIKELYSRFYDERDYSQEQMEGVRKNLYEQEFKAIEVVENGQSHSKNQPSFILQLNCVQQETTQKTELDSHKDIIHFENQEEIIAKPLNNHPQTLTLEELNLNSARTRYQQQQHLQPYELLSTQQTARTNQFINTLQEPNLVAFYDEDLQGSQISLMDTLKSQLVQQSLQIREKEEMINKLQTEKQLMQYELKVCNDQIQQFVDYTTMRDEVIKEKEEEIDRLQSEVKRYQEEKEQLSSAMIKLKEQLQNEIKLKKEDKAKLRDMEEVIEICREQLESFDNIHIISKQVIERLESQVSEYKYELEHAKDTIEKQHHMYYDLVINNFKSEVKENNENIPQREQEQEEVYENIVIASPFREQCQNIQQQQPYCYDIENSQPSSCMQSYR